MMIANVAAAIFRAYFERGADIADAQVLAEGGNVLHVEFVEGDAERLPYDAARFDGVVDLVQPDPLDQLVHLSHLIGQDPRLVQPGGGRGASSGSDAVSRAFARTARGSSRSSRGPRSRR